MRSSVLLLSGLISACSFTGGEPLEDDPPPDGPVDPPDDVDPVGDEDGDGEANESDNCWLIPNPAQHDEDNDGRGDECDNCPVTANFDQSNKREIVAGNSRDGLGDACDPRPTESGDRVAYFSSFHEDDGRWQVVDGSDQWSVVDGGLYRTDTDELSTIVLADLELEHAYVDAHLTVMAMDEGAASNPYGVAVVSHIEETDGYACLEKMLDDNNTVALYQIVGPTVEAIGLESAAAPSLAEGRDLRLTLQASGADGALSCSRLCDGQRAASVQSSEPRVAGRIGFHSYRAAAMYNYVAVYQLGSDADSDSDD